MDTLSTYRSQQMHLLRRSVLGRMLGLLAAWTLLFAAVAAFANAFVVPQIANAVAEEFAPWAVLSPEEADLENTTDWFAEKGLPLTGESPDETVVYPPDYDPNAVYYADGHMEYRDLAVYEKFRAMKLPVAMGCYLLGVAAVMWLALRRALDAFDKLFGAMENLVAKREAELPLPRELAPTALALDALQRESAANERAAKAAEQRKNELVAYLAHDIRTPLTSIVGYLTMLEESPDIPTEQRARYAGIALDRAYRLESMLEEFFEITRYNLQSIPLERQRFDAVLLCQQVADEFFPQAQARSIAVTVQAPPNLDVFADADKVSRVLNNLLKNAVSYADENSTVLIRAHRVAEPGRNASGDQGAPSAPGFPSTQDAPEALGTIAPARAQQPVSVAKETPSTAGAPDAPGAPSTPSALGTPGAPNNLGAASTFPLLVIEVENRGREISPAHLQSIFEKFYREDASRTSETGGSGLGLAIAREIAAAHGGTLTAESAHGRTVFTLAIPT